MHLRMLHHATELKSGGENTEETCASQDISDEYLSFPKRRILSEISDRSFQFPAPAPARSDSYSVFGLARTLGIGVCHDGTKALLVFSRRDERTDHCVLNAHFAERMAVDLIQPEGKSRPVRIAVQISEILSQHK